MHDDRFFQTTRGKIVSELRRRGSASAADLAHVFGLSPNAVRQQLMVLERDGLVAETSVRRGPTKPTYEFSLTPDADRLFPQAYDKMLSAVLREVRDQVRGAGGRADLRRPLRARGRARPPYRHLRRTAGASGAAHRDAAQERRRRGVQPDRRRLRAARALVSVLERGQRASRGLPGHSPRHRRDDRRPARADRIAGSRR